MWKRVKSMNIDGLTQSFFYSKAYIAIITIGGILGFVFSYEIEAILFVASFVVLNLFFQRDVLPSLLNLMIIGMIPLARYGDVDYFVPFFWYLEPFSASLTPYVEQYTGSVILLWTSLFVVIGVAVGFIMHFIIFPPHFKRGRFFYPTLFVMGSILFGGLFHLSVSEYFSFPAVYYVIFLGPVMMLIYVFIECYYPSINEKSVHHFASMMIGVGLMGIVMGTVLPAVGHRESIETIFQTGLERRYQWRNNLSNNLLMSMPFAFYLAVKTKWFVPFFLIGLLQYITLVFSYSRGGIIFSTLSLPILLGLTFVFMKKHRLKFVITLSFVTGALQLLFVFWDTNALVVIGDIHQRVTISTEEVRALMFVQALERFKAYPIFGTGFATSVIYSPQPMGMAWYHSTVSQVIGSLGLIGVITFLYQEMIRLYTLFEVPLKFNLFALVAFFGFSGYSLVNVGYFVPLPYVVMLLVMFMVVERYNRTFTEQPATLKNEKVSLDLLKVDS